MKSANLIKIINGNNDSLHNLYSNYIHKSGNTDLRSQSYQSGSSGDYFIDCGLRGINKIFQILNTDLNSLLEKNEKINRRYADVIASNTITNYCNNNYDVAKMSERGFNTFNKMYNCITFPTSDNHMLRNQALSSYFPKQWFEIMIRFNSINTLIDPLEYIYVDTNKFVHFTKIRVRNIRELLTYRSCEIFNIEKIKSTYNIEVVPENAFKKIRKLSDSTKLKICSYRFLHNDVYTLKKLYSFGMVNSPLCNRCGLHDEDTNHLLFECPKSKEIWQLVNNILTEITNENVVLDKNDILFGTNYFKYKNCQGINSILSKIKNSFIQIERPQPIIEHIKSQISQVIKIEKMYLSEIKFNKKWGKFV